MTIGGRGRYDSGRERKGTRYTPSQRSSDEAHRSDACVNQTAMKAAPIARAPSRPRALPAKIYTIENTNTDIYISTSRRALE